MKKLLGVTKLERRLQGPRHRLQDDAGPKAGECQVQNVSSEEIRVLARQQAFREVDQRDAEHANHQRAHRDHRVDARRQIAGVDAGAKLFEDLLLSLARERKPFVLAADARHRPLDEHQREVLRLLAAELVEPPERSAHALDRRRVLERRVVADRRRIAEQAEALLGEREEDVVLAGEVAVDSSGAVFDALRDLSNRDVLEALGDE